MVAELEQYWAKLLANAPKISLVSSANAKQKQHANPVMTMSNGRNKPPYRGEAVPPFYFFALFRDRAYSVCSNLIMRQCVIRNSLAISPRSSFLDKLLSCSIRDAMCVTDTDSLTLAFSCSSSLRGRRHHASSEIEILRVSLPTKSA